MFGPQFQWLPIGCRWSLSHQDYQKIALGLLLAGVSTQSEGVVARFAWQFLSSASDFGVPMVLLTMSFWENPKYFPQLKQSGTYVLNDCKVVCISCKLVNFKAHSVSWTELGWLVGMVYLFVCFFWYLVAANGLWIHHGRFHVIVYACIEWNCEQIQWLTLNVWWPN